MNTSNMSTRLADIGLFAWLQAKEDGEFG